MKRYNLFISDEQLDFLEKLSKHSVSVSEHIRIAINLYMEQLKKLAYSESLSKKGEQHGKHTK
jgi:hypothetical protein